MGESNRYKYREFVDPDTVALARQNWLTFQLNCPEGHSSRSSHINQAVWLSYPAYNGVYHERFAKIIRMCASTYYHALIKAYLCRRLDP